MPDSQAVSVDQEAAVSEILQGPWASAQNASAVQEARTTLQFRQAEAYEVGREEESFNAQVLFYAKKLGPWAIAGFGLGVVGWFLLLRK